MYANRSLCFGLAIGIQSCLNLTVAGQVIPTQPNQLLYPYDLSKQKSAKPSLTEAKWETAAIFHTLEAHHEPVIMLSFSPDGRWLASADSQVIMVWEVETGKLLRILPGHHSVEGQMAISPTALAFSPDGSLVASSTWSQGTLTPEKSIIIWETETGKEILSLNGKQGCRQTLFSPDGKKLFTACGLGIQVWQLETGKQLFSFATEESIVAATLSPDGQTMALTNGGANKTASNQIQLWQIADTEATLLTTLEGHTNEIAQLAFNSKGDRLISSSYDGKLKVWHWEKGVEWRSPFQSSNHGLFSLSPNGRWLAGNFAEGTILDLVNQEVIPTSVSVPPQAEASAVAFSPQGDILAWAGQLNTFPNPLIRLWQADRHLDINYPENGARAGYEPLHLARWWGNLPEQVQPVGTEPKMIVLAALGLTERVEREQEEIEVVYPQDNKAVATLTQTNLADDSVAGIRYRVEFAPYGSAGDSQRWRVIWAGKQYSCRSGRGHQDWSAALCQ